MRPVRADDGTLFIVMRYVDGGDLKKLLAEEGALEPERAAQLLAQTAKGLDAAHARGLVHRDVKPSNVLVSWGDDGIEHVYLADFGLTKTSDSAQVAHESATLSGSTDYITPEQIEGTRADHATDIYALGCVAFECLTGEVPFQGRNDLEVLFAHLEEEPPRPTTVNLALPAAVDAVTAKAMAKQPSERYGTGGELIDALRDAIAPRRATGRRLLLLVALVLAIAAAASVAGVLLTGDEEPAAGDAWSRVPHRENVFGGLGSLTANGVAVDRDTYVAVGFDDRGLDLKPAAWASADGRTWSRAAPRQIGLRQTGDQRMEAVAAGEQTFVAVGSEFVKDAADVSQRDFDAAVWTSPDGLDWTRVPHDETVFGGPPIGPDGEGNSDVAGDPSWQFMRAVTVGGPGFVAVGLRSSGSRSGAAVWISPDGRSWSRVVDEQDTFYSRIAGRQMTSVTEANGRLVAVGFESRAQRAHSAAVWTSDDGLSWARVPHDDTVFGSGSAFFQMNDVVAGGPGFVAVGIEMVEELARGYGDGRLPDADDSLTTRAQNGDYGGAIWTSEDGLTWSRIPAEQLPTTGEENVQLEAISAGGPGLTAVGWRDTADGVRAEVWTSSDGERWALAADPQRAFVVPDGQVMADVTAATGSSDLVAVGGSGSLLDFEAAAWVSP